MSRKVTRIMEWAARTVAVAALFVAFKPGQSLADLIAPDGPSSHSQDVVAGVVGDIDVDSEGEPTPAPE